MSSEYLSNKKNYVFEKIGFQMYEDISLNNIDVTEEDGEESPSSEVDPKEEETIEPEKPNEPKPIDPKNNYIGTIEIKKINLKKGFVEPSSKYNNIKYNVTIIDGSKFPDVKNGNFILAAHSGTATISFFKNLYKLKKGDNVDITYKNKKYTYKIVNIYDQVKQGYVGIKRDINKTTLTLITCTKDNKKSQTVYIAELI